MAYQSEVIVDAQPQAMGTSYTFSSQGSWNSDLCDCCSDMGICLCGTFVPCILACRVSEQANECCCLPFLPGTLIALRTGVREKYHIEVGSTGSQIQIECRERRGVAILWGLLGWGKAKAQPGLMDTYLSSQNLPFGLQGSILEDWMVMSCCPLCGLCQLARELNQRN
ncbi:hypothetical protein EYD10_11274, partial [Varanus komodoensis]